MRWTSLALLLVCAGPALRRVPLVPVEHQRPCDRQQLAPATPEAGVRGTEASGTWVWHFDPDLAERSCSIYTVLLTAASPDQRIVVAVTSEEEEELFRTLVGIGPHERRVTFLDVGRRLTIWARDRYIFTEPGGVPTVLTPLPAELPLMRKPDLSVGRGLARLGRRPVTSTALTLDGGNVIITDERAYVGASVVPENPQVEAAEIARQLEEVLGRPVAVIGDVRKLPHEHLDMFVSFAGPRLAVVGSPRLGLEWFDRLERLGIDEEVSIEAGTFLREQTEVWLEEYARVRRQLLDMGFKLIEVPAIHGEDDVVLTWVNAIVDRDGGKVFFPVYGIPFLDEMAADAWRSTGLAPNGIDCRELIRYGGALRCITNVMPGKLPQGETPSAPAEGKPQGR